MQSSSWVSVRPLAWMVIVLELLSVKTNPKFLAAETSAFSSGDWAWYSRLPSNIGKLI